MEKPKTEYKGYGYHGGGRPATGIKRVFVSVSCQPEESEFIKTMAKKRNKTISKYILDLVQEDSKN